MTTTGQTIYRLKGEIMGEGKQVELIRSAAVRVRRYRQRNTRIDYYPCPDVADIIAHHKATGSEKCIAGIIDGLVRVGHQTVSGNRGK